MKQRLFTLVLMVLLLQTAEAGSEMIKTPKCPDTVTSTNHSNEEEAKPMNKESIAAFFRNERNLMREKLYLHTDKPYYTAGDTIWYRGTLLNADTHSFLVHTNYIYVELFTKENSLVLRQKLKRDGLCFHNCIPLPYELESGEYYLRGYTLWMRNFGDTNFFYRPVMILRPGEILQVPMQEKMSEKGEKIKSETLLNEETEKLFVSQTANELTCHIPQKGDTDMEKGILVVHCRSQLLEVKEVNEGESIPLQPSRYPEGIIHFVLCSSDGKARQKCLYFNKRDESVQWEVMPSTLSPQPREKVRIDLCLKDKNGKPLRGDFSVSITDDEQVDSEVYTNNIVSELLMNSELERGIDNATWYLGKEKMYQTDDLTTILTGNNWKGFATDDLMLHSTLRDNYPIEAGQYISGRVKGLPKGQTNNKITAYNPEMKAFVTTDIDQDGRYMINGLDIPDSIGYFLKVLTPKKRGVVIETDSERMPEPKKPELYGYRKEKQITKNPHGILNGWGNNFIALPDLVVEEHYPSNPKTEKLPKEGSFNAKQLAATYDFNYIATALDLVNEIMLSRFPNKMLNCPSQTGPSEALLDEHIFSADFVEGPTQESDNTHPYYRDSYWGRLKSAIINDQEFYGFESVMAALSRIAPQDISRIDFIRHQHNPYYSEQIVMGNNGTSYVSRSALVSIRLKPGITLSSRQATNDPRLTLVFPQGYAWPKFFYHPTYEKSDAQKNSQRPDRRGTIYWHPSVQTDEEGKTYITFYTSDSAKNYTLTIEGVTINGKPVYMQQPLFEEAE